VQLALIPHNQNYLIGIEGAVFLDVEATPTRISK
jgi:hypothetical protein